jgi:hypothetical protein
MRRALVLGWGALGGRVADCWADYNERYWGGRLRPLPMFLTQVSPYGHWVGLTCISPSVRSIALTCPASGQVLVADRGVLLHEMTHQHLWEQGLCGKHDGQPWRDEIMRLNRSLTGKDIWAGAPTVVKEKDGDGARRSVRLNRPHPVTGQPSLSQADIARWPGSAGINLGPL